MISELFAPLETENVEQDLNEASLIDDDHSLLGHRGMPILERDTVSVIEKIIVTRNEVMSRLMLLGSN